MQRTYKTSDGEVAQVTINTHPVVELSVRDDHAPREWLRPADDDRPGPPGHGTRGARLPARAVGAHHAGRFTARGRREHRRSERCWWTATSRLDCATLYDQASGAGDTPCWQRMPTGSVVSFMLPNWHEAAVIYLAATLAGMVVNPILPSLRDHELRFILEDVDSRDDLRAAADFGGHDYAAMLERVTAAMNSAPDVVVLRGEAGSHTPYPALLRQPPDHREAARPGSRCRADGPLHIRHHGPPERCSAQP